ncbi:ribosomal protein S18-alanine N-acetyltransferase [Chloroflexota bacterium]
MPYYVRMMHKEDVPQVSEIDREAFPSQWPPTNYRNELQNRLAHYVVVCEAREPVEVPGVEPPPQNGLWRLASRMRRLFGSRSFDDQVSQPYSDCVLGFAGVWIMADEAHVINIAVRKQRQRQGIGELLFISAIDMGLQQHACIVTLEVRTSNTAAQSLYYKYGLTQVGLRRGYYLDDKEDAIVLSSGDATSVAFQARITQLKHAHSRRWGIPLYQIVG